MAVRVVFADFLNDAQQDAALVWNEPTGQPIIVLRPGLTYCQQYQVMTTLCHGEPFEDAWVEALLAS